MSSWRVTKYNPIYRDENGNYIKDEWTSISQLGEIYNNKKFTIDEYLEIENKYVNAIIICMEKLNVEWLEVSGLEKYNKHLKFEKILNGIYTKKMIELYDIISNGMRMNLHDTEIVSRLILRENMWCKLSNNGKMYVDFGYDYYMYIMVDDEFKDIIKENIVDSIYIEEYKSPYL